MVVVGGNVVVIVGGVVVVTTVVEDCASNSESSDLLHPAINTTATSSPATVLMPPRYVSTSRTARRASRLPSGNVRACHPRGCLRGCLEDYSKVTPGVAGSGVGYRLEAST